MSDSFNIRLYYGLNDFSDYIIKLNKKVNKEMIDKIKKSLKNMNLYFNDLNGEYWIFDRIIITKEKDYNLIFKKVDTNTIYFDLIDRC